MGNIKELLGDFVQTAVNDNSVESAYKKFPEFKDYDMQLLGDYVQTAVNYNSNDSAFVKFPEFHTGNEKGRENNSNDSAFTKLPKFHKKEKSGNEIRNTKSGYLGKIDEDRRLNYALAPAEEMPELPYVQEHPQFDGKAFKQVEFKSPAAEVKKIDKITKNNGLNAGYGTEYINPFPEYEAEDLALEQARLNKLIKEEAIKNDPALNQGWFWSTGVGNSLEAIGGGAMSALGGIEYALGAGISYLTGDVLGSSTVVGDFLKEGGRYGINKGLEIARRSDEGDILVDSYGDFRKKTADDYFSEGDFYSGFGRLNNEFAESTPLTTEVILASIFGSPALGAAIMGLSSAGSEMKELDENNPELSTEKRIVMGAAIGTIEAASEKLGDIPIGKMLKDVYRIGGNRAGIAIVRKSIDAALKANQRNGGVFGTLSKAAFWEGAEELSAGIGGNLVHILGGTKDWSVDELLSGVGEATEVGAYSGLIFGATAIPGIRRNKLYNKRLSAIGEQYKEKKNDFSEKFKGTNIKIDDALFLDGEAEIEKFYESKIRGNENISEIQKQSARDYLTAGAIAGRAANEIQSDIAQGIIKKISDDTKLGEARYEAELFVQAITNENSGNVITAKMRGVDTPINITRGEIVQNEDGSINAEKSSPTFFYKGTDGRLRIGKLSDLESITSIVPADEAVKETVQPIKDSIDNENAERQNVGSVAVVRDGNNYMTVRIIGENEDGTYQAVTYFDNEPYQSPVQPKDILPQFSGVFSANSEKREGAKEVEYIDPDDKETKTGFIELTPDSTAEFNGGYAMINGKSIPFENIKGVKETDGGNNNEGIFKELTDEQLQEQYDSIRSAIDAGEVELTTSQQGYFEELEREIEQRQNKIQPIGEGAFGAIYDQFRGKAKEAIAFLMGKKGGEALGALHHKDIGDIDLVWGKEGTGQSDGYGLSKLAKYHPEVLDNLQEILNEMHIAQRSENRINLESDKYQAAVRLEWDNQRKTWLLTAFEKKNAVSDSRTDIDKTENGKQNDTATLQNGISETEIVSNDKDTTSLSNEQEKQNFFASLPKNKQGDIDFGAMGIADINRYNEYEYGAETALSEAAAARKAKSAAVFEMQKQLEKTADTGKRQKLLAAINRGKTEIAEYNRYLEAADKAEQERQEAALEEQRTRSKEQRQAGEQKSVEAAGANIMNEKWNSAPKIVGNRDVWVTPSGQRYTGTWIATEAGAYTPSHDVRNNFANSEGYPLTEKGENLNTTDYKDLRNQTEVIKHSNPYDERGAGKTVVVGEGEQAGMVVSNNSGGQAKELAVINGVYKSSPYYKYYLDYGTKYGKDFTPENLEKFDNADIVFVLDEIQNVTPEMMADFNTPEVKMFGVKQKAESRSKSLNDITIIKIADFLNDVDNLSDVYNNADRTQELIKLLMSENVLQSNEVQALLNENGSMSGAGRDMFEALMLGSAFESKDIAQITAFNETQKAVIFKAIPRIIENKTLGKFSVTDYLSEAIEIVTKANKAGTRVELEGRQQDAFTGAHSDQAINLAMALAIDDKRETGKLRKIFEDYNNSVRDEAQGGQNMFGERVPSEVLAEVLRVNGFDGVFTGVSRAKINTVINSDKDTSKGKQRENISTVTDKQIADIKERTGIDVTGYSHTIDKSEINHTIKNHGNGKTEESRGQIAVTENDFLKIPDILENYDAIEYVGKNSKGLDVIRYTKTFNETVFVYEEIRSGKKELAFATMFKRKISGDKINKPSVLTSETTSDLSGDKGTQEKSNDQIKSEEKEKDFKTERAEDGKEGGSFLSEREYIEQGINDYVNEHNLNLEDFEETDEYIDIENEIIDNYPQYISDLKKSGQLQSLYDNAKIEDEIKIRKGIDAAGFEFSDLINSEQKKQKQKEERAKKKEKTAYQKLVESGDIRFQFDTSGITDKNAAEMQAIKDEAVRNGTFMKAPNGADTKLNERQWLQVRTAAFKRWFGDWLKLAQINKLRESKAIEITGKEIADFKGKDLKDGKDLKEFKALALEYGKRLRGEYVNKDTGEKILVARGGIQEVLRHDGGDIAHIQSVAAIPQFIENGIYIDTVENEDKEKHPNIKEYQYFVSGLKINDVDYTVKLAIAVDRDGKRYYDHALTNIEKGKLLDEAARVTSTPRNQGVELDYKDKRLFSILQIDEQNISKVVDVNGEPLVVYHGTNAEFTEFTNQNNGGNYWGDGYYFTDSKKGAEGFSKMKGGENVIDAFLNIKNPLIINETTDFAAIEKLLGTDTGIDNVPDYGYDSWSKYVFGYKSDLEQEEIRQKLTSAGYDGMLIEGYREKFAIAFTPSQIKSAIDNNGNFDNESNDIRFAINGKEPRTADEAARFKKEEIDKQISNLRIYISDAKKVLEEIDNEYKQSEKRKEAMREATQRDIANGVSMLSAASETMLTTKKFIENREQAKQLARGKKKQAEQHLVNLIRGKKSAIQKAREDFEKWQNAQGSLFQKTKDGKDLKDNKERKTNVRRFIDLFSRTLGVPAGTRQEMVDVLERNGYSLKGYKAAVGLLNANARWNKELDDFNGGKLKPNEVLHLGKPLGILQAAGLKSGEITISQKTLADHLKAHGLEISEIKNLAKAIQQPILVYQWGKNHPATTIVTELETKDGRKISVGIRLENKGKDLTVNEIATIHGKTAEYLLNDFAKSTPEWLSENVKWVEKEKVLHWLDAVPPKGTMQTEGLSEKSLNWLGLSTPIPNQGLSEINIDIDNAAKVIQNFENPKINEENLLSQFENSDLRLLTTDDGTQILGFTDGKKVYFDEDAVDVDTPIHEYTHVFSSYRMDNDREGWRQTVAEFKHLTPDPSPQERGETGTNGEGNISPAFAKIDNAPQYQAQLSEQTKILQKKYGISASEARDWAVTDELLAQMGGARGKQRAGELLAMADGSITVFAKMQAAWRRFWNAVIGKLFPNVTRGNIRAFPVWHGTPNEIQGGKISTAYIGTGEGAQAYGYGLYFTDLLDIAKSYSKEHLSRHNLDLEIAVNSIALENKLYDKQKIEEFIKNRKLSKGSKIYTKHTVIDYGLLKKMKEYVDTEAFRDLNLQIPQVLQAKIHGDKTVDELNFMRWDKPVPDKIKELIKEKFEEKDFNIDDLGGYDYRNNIDYSIDSEELTGKELYKMLEKFFEDDYSASEFLLHAGIDGIQYPTEYQSKGQHEESFNYVVFDDNAVEIEETIRLQAAVNSRIKNLESQLEKAKAEYDAISNNEQYRELNFVGGGNLSKASNNRRNAIREKLAKAADKISLLETAIKIEKDTPFTERDIIRLNSFIPLAKMNGIGFRGFDLSFDSIKAGAKVVRLASAKTNKPILIDTKSPNGVIWAVDKEGSVNKYKPQIDNTLFQAASGKLDNLQDLTVGQLGALDGMLEKMVKGELNGKDGKDLKDIKGSESGFAGLEDLQDVNARFNSELEKLTAENARSKILWLGSPSEILQTAGINNKPLKLYGAKLISKAQKHGFNFSDLKNLPEAVQNPIAVFKGSVDGSHAILTELTVNDKNVLVTLNIGKDQEVDFNIVTSTYGKSSDGIIGWINNGKLLYADKEKALNYLRISAPIAEAQDKTGLSEINTEIDNATKVIQNFENPKIIDKKTKDGNDLKDIKSAIAAAEAETNTNPTEAQKKAGNYKMGHVRVQGFDITIENPKGSVRSGVDENGRAWETEMNNTYGYFGNTESKDGDHIDVFLGDNPLSEKVFVIDQTSPPTPLHNERGEKQGEGEKAAFDEHKVMFGFDSLEEAKAAYLSNYGKGWQGLGNITETDVESFRDWAKAEGRRIKPFAEYKNIQNNLDNSEKGGNFAEQNKKYESGNETRLGNSGTMGSSAAYRLVGKQSQGRGIEQTIAESVGRGGDATAVSGIRGGWNKHAFLQRLEKAARKNSAWIDDISELINPDVKFSGGWENEPYLSTDGKHVIKLNNLNFLNDDDTQYKNTRDFDYFIDRLNAHNELFPKDKYEIIGFADNSAGAVSVVLKQPFVEGAQLSDMADVEKWLADNGFEEDHKPDGMRYWTNGKYEISDVKPENVLVDRNGDLRFIDTDIVPVINKIDGSGLRFQTVNKGENENRDGSRAAWKGARTTPEYYQWAQSLGDLEGIAKPKRTQGEKISDFYNRIMAWSVANNPTNWSAAQRKMAEDWLKGDKKVFAEQQKMAEISAAAAEIKDPAEPEFRKGTGNENEDLFQFATRRVAWREQRFINGVVRAERLAEAQAAAERGDTPIDHFTARMELDNQLLTVWDKMPRRLRRALERLHLGEKNLGNMEMWVDDKIYVKKFLDYLRSKGTNISDIDDYYMRVTALQGKNDTGFNNYVETYQTPINDWLEAEIKDTGLSYRDFENYVFLRHGKERNEFFQSDGKHKKADYAGVYAVAAELYAKENGIPFDPKNEKAVKDVLVQYAADKGIKVKAGKETDIYDELFADKELPEEQEQVLVTRGFFDNMINDYIAEVESAVNSVEISANGKMRKGAKEIEEANKRFNKELEQLNPENANSKVFDLGNPSDIATAVGVPNKPYRLYGNKIIKKAKEHGYNPRDLADLPRALANPIAVFDGGNGVFNILTEVEINGKKALVGVQSQHENELDFNFIATVFDKSESGIVNWINKGKSLYLNKEQTLNYLGGAAPIAAAVNNSEFDATKLQKEIDTAKDNVQNFENPAIHHKNIENFWEMLRAANDFSINTMVKGGIITEAAAAEIRERYKYYVPLRGHEVEAEKTYDYMPDAGVFFSNPNINARGRITRGESPFAYMAQMAHSAVVMVNRNDLNKTMLRIARRDKTGLITQNKTWYIKTGTDAEGNAIWEEAEIDKNGEVQNDFTRAEYEAWNERMKELAKEGNAKQMSKGVNLDGLFIKKKQDKQHAISVIENGEEYQVYINGNPKVSRAINGLNRSEAKLRWLSKMKSMIGQNLTSRNPAFMLANFSRDTLFAESILPAKEGAAYTAQYLKNIAPAMKALTEYQLSRGIAGHTSTSLSNHTRNDGGKYLNYAREFFENGGETGYTHLWELNDLQKEIDKAVGNVSKGAKAFDTLMKPLDEANKIIENSNRLAVYIASRESGRTVIRSISDAKEVTLNFNRRGAGGGIVDYVRPAYLFVNAGIQALNNFIGVYKKHPAKMTAVVCTYMMSGMLMPLLNAALMGGDDDEYWNLPDYDRQNNLCIWVGNGFVKIPLPQELRIFHRIGDNISQTIFGKQKVSDGLLNTMEGMLDLVPINPSGAVSVSSVELVPDAFKPFAQVYWSNKSFTGAPIAKDELFMREGLPQSHIANMRTNRKGEARAPKGVIVLAQTLNAITGGNKYEKGLIDINPDKLNALGRGYLGGLYTTAISVLELRPDKPITSRFYTTEKDLNEKLTGNNLGNAYDKINAADNKLDSYKARVADLQRGELTIQEFARDTAGVAAAQRIHALSLKLKKINKELKIEGISVEQQAALREVQKVLISEIVGE